MAEASAERSEVGDLQGRPVRSCSPVPAQRPCNTGLVTIIYREQPLGGRVTTPSGFGSGSWQKARIQTPAGTPDLGLQAASYFVLLWGHLHPQ